MLIFSVVDSDSSVYESPFQTTMMSGVLDTDENGSPDDCTLAPLWVTTTQNSSSSTTAPDIVCNHFTFLLYGVVAGVVCLLGLVGNLISIIVLSRDSKTPIASFQLSALAIADNLFLALWFVHYSLRYALRFLGSPDPAALTYVRVHTFPVLYTAQTWTIWLTVVIAFTRYVAVCWPYLAPRIHNIDNIRLQISAVTLFTIAYNIPRYGTVDNGKEPSLIGFGSLRVLPNIGARFGSCSFQLRKKRKFVQWWF